MPVPGGGNSRWSPALPAPERALPGPGARLCPLARRGAVEGKQIIGMTDDIAGGGANPPGATGGVQLSLAQAVSRGKLAAHPSSQVTCVTGAGTGM